MRLTHGEGLARQNAIENNAAEQVVLGDVRQDEAEVARLFRQRNNNVRAVDVVDLRGGVGLEISVQTGLDGSDRNGPLRVLDNEHAGLVRRAEREEVRVLTLGSLVGNVSLAALAVVEVGQSTEQLIGVYAEQGTVDRLDDQAFVMDVDNLNECKTCRMVLLLLCSQALLDLFPVCLCGGHGVVAVAYCIRQQRLCGRTSC